MQGVYVDRDGEAMDSVWTRSGVGGCSGSADGVGEVVDNKSGLWRLFR